MMLQHEYTGSPSVPDRRKKISWLIASALTAALLLGGALVIPALRTEPPTAAMSSQSSTVEVTAGDMVSETRVPGTVVYKKTTDVTAGTSGVITELPPPGSELAAGGVLYRIATRPVIVLAGTVPAWRDFTAGMSDGEDILQLERNLVAFGFFEGEPDTRFDWNTTTAVREWQRSIGVEDTGVVERSFLMFWDGTVRIDTLDARVGDEVGPGATLYTATSPEKVVDVEIASTDRALAVIDQPVQVALPDGGSAEGVIIEVGSPYSRDSEAEGPSVVVPVRIDIADQSAVADLALANVTVVFESTLRSDVLTVPIDALVPVDDTHYAVELPPTGDSRKRRLIPVEIGATGSGRVEISGEGIEAGLLVVVPTR